MGPPTPEFGPKSYYLARFLPKLDENEINWTERGRTPGAANVDGCNCPEKKISQVDPNVYSFEKMYVAEFMQI